MTLTEYLRVLADEDYWRICTELEGICTSTMYCLERGPDPSNSQHQKMLMERIRPYADGELLSRLHRDHNVADI